MSDAEQYLRTDDWPLSFVAQIDLAEVQGVHALDGFPSVGHLLLFCDAHFLPWGRPEHQPRARIFFFQDRSATMERRPAPKAFDRPEARALREEGFVFSPRRLRPTVWLSPPALGSADFLRLQGEDSEAWGPAGYAFTAYEQFWTEFAAQQADAIGGASDTVHQLGGAALSIQKPVEAECARLSTMDDDWKLVLQIDSDPLAGMQWGDDGRLFVCIRRADLVERRFDRCWTLIQSY